MRKQNAWKFFATALMLLLSTKFVFLHYLIFRDARHIFIYLIGDIAFLFLEVLLVTSIIQHLFNKWERNNQLKKLNMVIEVFSANSESRRWRSFRMLTEI